MSKEEITVPLSEGVGFLYNEDDGEANDAECIVTEIEVVYE